VKLGHVAILEWALHHLLSTGIERDDFGATPVHDAAEQNQLECLHVFHRHCVNLEAKDTDGMTPLDLAREKQNIHCVHFLENPAESLQLTLKKSRDTKVRKTNDLYLVVTLYCFRTKN